MGSIVIALTLTIYAIKFPTKYDDSKLENIGIEHSTLIYILHPIFTAILSKIYKIFELSNIKVLNYIQPIIICILTTFSAMVFYKISYILKSKKNMKNLTK